MRGPFVKVFGLQRSGTNYLSWLLQSNFDVQALQHAWGWKHGPPVLTDDSDQWCPPWASARVKRDVVSAAQAHNLPPLSVALREGRVGKVCAVRHPLVWLAAIQAYLSSPRRASGLPRREHALLELWSARTAEYLVVCPIVRQEDMEQRPVEVVRRLANVLGLPIAADPVRYTSARMYAGGDRWDPDALASSAVHRPRLPAKPSTAALRALDPEVVERAGYPKLARRLR